MVNASVRTFSASCPAIVGDVARARYSGPCTARTRVFGNCSRRQGDPHAHHLRHRRPRRAGGLHAPALAMPSRPATRRPTSPPRASRPARRCTFSLADARKKGPVVLYFFPAADTKGCNLEAKMFADACRSSRPAAADGDWGHRRATWTAAASSRSDTDKCYGQVPGRRRSRQPRSPSEYDCVLAVKPDWSDRTSYVPIAPTARCCTPIQAGPHRARVPGPGRGEGIQS